MKGAGHHVVSIDVSTWFFLSKMIKNQSTKHVRLLSKHVCTSLPSRHSKNTKCSFDKYYL